jgi:uncharacterized protein
MTLVGILLLGLMIGAVLGGLGGGGAVLTVPAMVYLLGQSAQAATTGSLVVVGLSALTGVASHLRSGQVHWRVASGFGLLGLPGTWLGSRLNHGIDEDTLLLGFSALMLVAAVAMAVDRAGRCATEPRPSPGALAGAAVLVGLLTGFFGVGGGFVVVPALTLLLGLPIPQAVGTSLVVVALNAGTALAARAGGPPIDASVVVPFALAAMVAAVLGKHAADHLPARGLTVAFAAVLALVAGGTATQSLHDLAGDRHAGQASPRA